METVDGSFDVSDWRDGWIGRTWRIFKAVELF